MRPQQNSIDVRDNALMRDGGVNETVRKTMFNQTSCGQGFFSGKFPFRQEVSGGWDIQLNKIPLDKIKILELSEGLSMDRVQYSVFNLIFKYSVKGL